MPHAIRRPLAIVLAVAVVLIAIPAGAVTLVPVPVNQCLAGKLKCARTMKHCLLKALTLAGGTDSDPGGPHKQACRDRFDGGSTPAKGCFAKLEAGLSCPITGDTATIAQGIAAFVGAADGQLDPPPAHNESKCRVGKIKCLDKYDSCVLDTVRRAARTTGVIEPERLAKCTAILTGPKSCFAKLESKLTCETVDDQGTIHQRDDLFLDDLVADLIVGPRAIDNRRCTGDLSVQCTAPADCTGIGTCEYFVGAPVPSNVFGVATCIANRISGALTGTVNVSTGATAGSVTLVRDIYNGITQTHPCPTCDGDAFRNDGAAAGTCTGGTRNGLACDANGVSVIPQFGTTSLDCPPSSGFIGSISMDLAAANEGTTSLAITPASPVCRGLPGAKCPCDVCSLATSTPCTSNADCVGFGTCGGGPAGEPPKPNSCLDGVCDLDVGNNQFVCAAGPTDQHCVVESFRGCTVPEDCPAAGDSCGTFLRPCFPGSGAVGDAVTAPGAHGTPDFHAWNSTFGSPYCSAPTVSSPSVNAIFGLPGPGRIRVTGTLSDDGSTGSCPSLLTFVPDYTLAVSDTGWTGLGHGEHVVSNAAVTAAVSGCAGAPPSCGECAFNGPVPNPNAP